MERQTFLSSRLRAIAAMVEKGSRLADIGTDHGYLPIRLLEEKRISMAIAMDVKDGPLLRARAHVEERGFSELIKLRLSDGFSALAPGEADVAVIAGMGGRLIIRILEDGKKTARSLRYLILSPQSELFSVRHYLLENGYGILAEEMVLDEGKYYTVLKAAYGRKTDMEDAPWDYIEKCYGRYLLCSGNPVVVQFLKKEKHTCESVKEQLLLAETDKARKRLSQIEEQLELLDTAICMAEEKIKECGKNEDQQ